MKTENATELAAGISLEIIGCQGKHSMGMDP